MNTLQRLFIIALIHSPAFGGWQSAPYTNVGKKNISSTTTQTTLSQKNQRKEAYRTLNREKLHKKSKDMSLAEAQQAKKCYEILEKDDMLVTMLERILALTNNSQESRSCLLDLADAYTRQGDLKKAQQLYRQYILLFPGAENIEYVYYQEIMVNFWDLLTIDRDQQKTVATIILAQNFLKEFPSHTLYTASVHDVLKTCYTNLLHHELTVIHHYITKYKYSHNEQALAAAVKRFEYIKTDIIPHLISSPENPNDRRFVLMNEKIQKLLTSLSPSQSQAQQSSQPAPDSPVPLQQSTPAIVYNVDQIEELLADCQNVLNMPAKKSMTDRF